MNSEIYLEHADMKSVGTGVPQVLIREETREISGSEHVPAVFIHTELTRPRLPHNILSLSVMD